MDGSLDFANTLVLRTAVIKSMSICHFSGDVYRLGTIMLHLALGERNSRDAGLFNERAIVHEVGWAA
jgi:hypothetical protein